MYFDCAPQGGECRSDNQLAPASFGNQADSLQISNRCDTTFNTAVRNLPAVELSLLVGSDLNFRPQTAIPTAQVNQNPEVLPPKPKVGPSNPPDALPRPGDLGPGASPFAPAPMQGSFSNDQVRQILADRDKALALNRGQKPGDSSRTGPLPPSPDGRVPNFPIPNTTVRPGDNKPRPEVDKNRVR